jgi:membrane-associated phospholipid phosphatase
MARMLFQRARFRFVISLAWIALWPRCGVCDPYLLTWDNESWYLATAAALHGTAWLGAQQKSAPGSQSADALDRSDIPVFERRFAGGWDRHAQHQSDVLEAIGLLAPLALLAAPQGRAGTIAALYAETLLIASGGVTITKNWVDRSRPYAYGDSAPRSVRASLDSTRSFLSGHTAHLAAAMSFSATVLGDLNPNAAGTRWLWPAGAAVTLYEAHLRVAGGKHFPSDTLFGALWGGWIGYAVPTRHATAHAGAWIEPVLLGAAPGIGVKIDL